MARSLPPLNGLAIKKRGYLPYHWCLVDFVVLVTVNRGGHSGLSDALMHGFGLGVSICITNLIKYKD